MSHVVAARTASKRKKKCWVILSTLLTQVIRHINIITTHTHTRTCYYFSTFT